MCGMGSDLYIYIYIYIHIYIHIYIYIYVDRVHAKGSLSHLLICCGLPIGFLHEEQLLLSFFLFLFC